jgi:hypothetical protein
LGLLFALDLVTNHQNSSSKSDFDLTTTPGRKRCQIPLGRTIAFQDIPVEPWQDSLLKRGLPAHLVKHLATMADLHRAGRYDRMSDDVLTLTGQGPMRVQEFIRKNASAFTASAKEG